jgi:hypothetical protein
MDARLGGEVRLAHDHGQLRALELECAVPAMHSGRSHDEHGAPRGRDSRPSRTACARL